MFSCSLCQELFPLSPRSFLQSDAPLVDDDPPGVEVDLVANGGGGGGCDGKLELERAGHHGGGQGRRERHLVGGRYRVSLEGEKK